MDILLISGWLLVAAAICCAQQVQLQDQRLRKSVPPAVERRWRQQLLRGAQRSEPFEFGKGLQVELFLILPVRWDRDHYDSRGAAVVDRLWLFAAAACVLLPLGLLLIEAAVTG